MPTTLRSRNAQSGRSFFTPRDYQLGRFGARAFGRRGLGAFRSGVRAAEDIESPSNILIAREAAVMPNTAGTNATEPSTRLRCSQSLTPFSPPGQTQRKPPSSYARSTGGIGDSSL